MTTRPGEVGVPRWSWLNGEGGVRLVFGWFGKGDGGYSWVIAYVHTWLARIGGRSPLCSRGCGDLGAGLVGVVVNLPAVICFE